MMLDMTKNTAAELAAVNTDALIEGNAAGMATISAEIASKFDDAVSDLVARLQAASDRWMACHAPNVALGTYERDTTFRGRRFVRIVRHALGSRSVVCFIEKGTGLIYKPATFKAPTDNFTRGCVFNLGNAWRTPDGAPVAILPHY